MLHSLVDSAYTSLTGHRTDYSGICLARIKILLTFAYFINQEP